MFKRSAKSIVSKCLVVFFSMVLFVGFSSAAAAEDIIVSGAASLTESFGEMSKAFMNKFPEHKVETNFASSGNLLQQIKSGAPVDVFASADQKTMDQAEEANVIDKPTRRNFIANSIVLVVPANSNLNITKLADLKDAKVKKVSIGNPASVPVGRYAEESLIKEGIVKEITPKLILGDSVKQVVEYAARGEVDAAIIFSTDAKAAKEKIKVIAELGGHSPIEYPVAIVSASSKKGTAEEFIKFLLSKEGQDIMAKYGFKTAQ